MKQCPLCKIYLEDEQHLSEHAEGAHNSRFIDMKPQNKRNLSQEVTDMTVEYIKSKQQNNSGEHKIKKLEDGTYSIEPFNPFIDNILNSTSIYHKIRKLRGSKARTNTDI